MFPRRTQSLSSVDQWRNYRRLHHKQHPNVGPESGTPPRRHLGGPPQRSLHEHPHSRAIQFQNSGNSSSLEAPFKPAESSAQGKLAGSEQQSAFHSAQPSNAGIEDQATPQARVHGSPAHRAPETQKKVDNLRELSPSFLDAESSAWDARADDDASPGADPASAQSEMLGRSNSFDDSMVKGWDDDDADEDEDEDEDVDADVDRHDGEVSGAGKQGDANALLSHRVHAADEPSHSGDAEGSDIELHDEEDDHHTMPNTLSPLAATEAVPGILQSADVPATAAIQIHDRHELDVHDDEEDSLSVSLGSPSDLLDVSLGSPSDVLKLERSALDNADGESAPPRALPTADRNATQSAESGLVPVHKTGDLAIIETLSKVDVLRGLSRAEIENVARHLAIQEFDEGDVIVKEGQVCLVSPWRHGLVPEVATECNEMFALETDDCNAGW